MVSRVTYSDVLGLPDILSTDNFILYLKAPQPVITKLGSTTIADSIEKKMIIKCQSTSVPSFSNEAFDVSMHGFVLKQRGQKRYGGNTLSATFIEEANMETYKYLYAWSEVVVGTYTGKSEGYKGKTSGGTNRYSSDECYLEIFDTTGKSVDQIGFLGLFPQEIQDISLSVENSASVQVSATFSFDLFYRIGGGYIVSNPT